MGARAGRGTRVSIPDEKAPTGKTHVKFCGLAGSLCASKVAISLREMSLGLRHKQAVFDFLGAFVLAPALSSFAVASLYPSGSLRLAISSSIRSVRWCEIYSASPDRRWRMR